MAVLTDGTIVDTQGNPTGGQVNVQTGQFVAPPITPSNLTSNEAPANITPITSTNPAELQADIASSLKLTEQQIALLQGQKSASETTQNTLMSDILSTLKQGQGREQAQFEAEQQAGIPEQNKRLQELIGRLTQLQNESLAIPLQIQEEFAGTGATRGGVEPIETARLRQNAIQSLTIGSQAQALQGNIALAQQQVNRAVDLEFKPIEDRLQFLQTAYTLNKDILDREDKKRSEQLQIQLEERSRLLAEQKEERKLVQNTMIEAARSGASQDVLERIQNSSPEQAIALTAKYLGADFARQQAQQAFENGIALRGVEIQEARFRAESRKDLLDRAAAGDSQAIAELGYDPADQPLTYEEQKQKENLMLNISEDLDVVNRALKNSTGLEAVSGLKRGTGLGPLAWINPAVPLYTKQKAQNFLSDAKFIINNLTLNRVSELAAQGVKLNPITEEEIRLMGQSAKALVAAAEYDDGGNIVGFSISDSRVREEMQNIQTHWSNAVSDIMVELNTTKSERDEAAKL